MSRVALVVSENRDESAVIERAIDLAAERDAELIVLTVLDPATLDKAQRRLIEHGQVGARPSRHVLDAVSRRHEVLAESLAHDIVERAVERGLEARSSVRRGAFARELRAFLLLEKPDVIVADRPPRSWMGFRNHARVIPGMAAEMGLDLVEV